MVKSIQDEFIEYSLNYEPDGSFLLNGKNLNLLFDEDFIEMSDLQGVYDQIKAMEFGWA